MKYNILYRGPLADCNYDCPYCPFAKRRDSGAELARDREALNRFAVRLKELAARGDEIGVFFTPWGEALVRSYYRETLGRLSHVPGITRVAIQTNLSAELAWTRDCDRNRLALWSTFHPGQTSRENFLGRCEELDRWGIAYSVGVVGLKEHLDDIAFLRERLRAGVYLWVNAYKREKQYYNREEIAFLKRVDPLFEYNLKSHASLGRACLAGEAVFSVDGEGVARRCHFIQKPIGDFYRQDPEEFLETRACVNRVCGCHIGYVHMPELKLYDVFGKGILPRIPERV